LLTIIDSVVGFFDFLAGTWALVRDNREAFLLGYATTVLVSLGGMVGALAIGALAALMRTAPLRPTRVLGAIYVEFFRNTPLLVQTFFYFFALPRVVLLGFQMPPLSAFTVGVIALSVYTGAFTCEAIRSGITSIERGQTEAARSLGLPYFGTMRYVVLPQAFRIVLPPLGNLGIALVKNSSIMYAIALPELFFVSALIETRTFRYQETFTVAVVAYLSLTLPLAYFVGRLERWSARSR
jgi:aspartate/glutamate/glutamine transport system permease protein